MAQPELCNMYSISGIEQNKRGALWTLCQSTQHPHSCAFAAANKACAVCEQSYRGNVNDTAMRLQCNGKSQLHTLKRSLVICKPCCFWPAPMCHCNGYTVHDSNRHVYNSSRIALTCSSSACCLFWLLASLSCRAPSSALLKSSCCCKSDWLASACVC